MPRQKPNLGLLPWITIQCGLPHSRPLGPNGVELAFYERTNGTTRLIMLADPRVGLPYGKIPRLLLAHLVVQYKRNLAQMSPEQARYIDLGRSWASFLRKLGLERGGGDRGAYTRFHEQALRLFAANIQSRRDWEPGSRDLGYLQHHTVAAQACLWWWDPNDTEAPNVHNLRDNYIRLSEHFAEACEVAVPVSLDTLAALRSPFAIDLYAWLSYRCAKLHQQGEPMAEISWSQLQRQFGHGYRRQVDFKKAFRRHLRTVLDHYPARVDHQSWPEGITVFPHPPHIERRLR